MLRDQLNPRADDGGSGPRVDYQAGNGPALGTSDPKFLNGCPSGSKSRDRDEQEAVEMDRGLRDMVVGLLRSRLHA